MATLASNVWITLADTKEYLGISSGDTDNDDRIINLINRATQVVETYLGRTVLQATYTNEVYDGTGSYDLLLNNYPVSSVTSLAKRDTPYTDSWNDTVDSNDFYVDSVNGTITKVTAFSEPPAQYRVTYVAGYALADVPNDLSLAVLDIVSYLWNAKGSQGKSSERLGEYSVTWKASAQTLADIGVTMYLDPYRKMAGF